MGEDTRSPRTVVSDNRRRWSEEERDVYVRRCAFRLQKLFELSIAKSDMITLRENRDAYSRLRLMPKILVDVSSVSTGTNLILLSSEMNYRLQGIQNVPTSLYNIFSPDASLDQLTESDISMTSTIISDFAIDNSNSFCSRKAHLLT